MFYRLNKLTGRLARSQQLKAMLPQGLRPYVEPPPIYYDSAFKLSQTPVQEMRKLAKSGPEYGAVPEKLKKLMIQFQKEDGIPVHFKGGTKDYVLFGFTLLVLAFGLFESFRFVYENAFPKKQQNIAATPSC